MHLYLREKLTYSIVTRNEKGRSTEMTRVDAREDAETPAEVANIMRNVEVVIVDEEIKNESTVVQNTRKTEMMMTLIYVESSGRKTITKRSRGKRHAGTMTGTVSLATSQNTVSMKVKGAREHVLLCDVTHIIIHADKTDWSSSMCRV